MLVAEIPTEPRELPQVVGHSAGHSVHGFHFNHEEIAHLSRNMHQEVRLVLAPDERMTLLVDLPAQREAETVWPVATPTVVKFVAVDSFAVLRLLSPGNWKLKVLGWHLGGGAEQPLGHELQLLSHRLLLSVQPAAISGRGER
jgi:hypothetical protein